MEDGGLYCPVEECEANRGGYCTIRQDGPLGWASTAFFMPGQTGFLAPFGPVPGMFRSDATAEGQPPAAPEWGMWRNCPRLKDKNQRK
jgi:hypothetical protein